MEIAIIGAGITGLTTALALHKMGFSCTVYEQASQLQPVGAGIWLQPNAIKVMDWLGLKQEILAQGVQLNKVEITNSQLEPFKKTNMGIVMDEEGHQITSIHRARLQQILYDAVVKNTSVHLGQTYQDHQVTDGKVRIQFSEGKKTSDLLLGADGIHSKVRNALFPQSSLRYAHQTCWRGISGYQLPPALQHSGREAWGKGIRFGFSQVSADQVYWFAVAKAAPGGKDQVMKVQSALIEKFKVFNPYVVKIIKHTAPDKIIRNDLYDLKKLSDWHKGPACLIGDAGHATTPNMGQGAGQGIEDAYYLSHFMTASSNYQAAFDHFQHQRRKKVDYVVNNSWRLGQAAHHPIGQNIMKLILKITPEKVMVKQMQKLFSIKKFSS